MADILRILEIKNIERKDVPIYYRRFYTGFLILELFKKQEERQIEFMIEIKPTGHKEISITLNEAIDYPLVPLMNAIKQYIHDLDSEGGLPV